MLFSRVLPIVLLATLASASVTASAKSKEKSAEAHPIQLGVRPFYLVENMDEGALKDKLEACQTQRFYKTDFSIGHRGAALQFPEHTAQSYRAAALQGAGIIECDVAFTKDKGLVCRHSQCDLHTTTNILAIPQLAAKCSEPFQPANPVTGEPASAKCCTSDITLAEFKSLCGKMDASNPNAQTVAEYLGGTADFRTDLYAQCATVLSHQESIELIGSLDAKFTPELKFPSVEMPYEGTYSQADYARAMVQDYIAAGISPKKVWLQSFNYPDLLLWVKEFPRFGRQAVYLDSRMYEEAGFVATLADMERIKADGINIIAPPMWALLTLDADNNIIPSEYANFAKQAGLDIITWTFERDGPLANGGGWYHQSIRDAINNDGDAYTVLDVLAQDVGVIGVFSDWPASVTYYANCVDLGKNKHRHHRK